MHTEKCAHITTEQAHEIERRTQRAQFLALPLHVQQETIARVRRTLAAERARGQVQPSALRQLAASVYGIQE